MSSSASPPQLPLVERSRPARLDDLVGNSRARTELRAWAESWTRQRRPPTLRAAILSGPPGVGKTSAALALANDLGWTVVELNASDARNEAAIDQIAGRAGLTNTLGSSGTYRGVSGGGRALILLDEADCLSGRAKEESRARAKPEPFREFLRARYGTLTSLAEAWGLGTSGSPHRFESWNEVPQTPGRATWTRLRPAQRDIDDWRGAAKPSDQSDRGGIGAIARLVRTSFQPVILTVNDDAPLTRYSPVFRSAVARIRWHPLLSAEVEALVRSVARRERIPATAAAVEQIVRRSQGDLRAALNDLDAIAPLPPGSLQLEVLGGRDRTNDFYELVETVFSEPRYFRSTEIRDRLDATPDDLLPWIEENVPRLAADPFALSAGIDRVATAERWLSRARRHRVYSLWSYASELMTGGASLALSLPPRADFPAVAFPQFLGMMGRTRTVRMIRQSILTRIRERYHLSRRKAIDAMLGTIQVLLEKATGPSAKPMNLDVGKLLAENLQLNAEEVGFLIRQELDSPAVRSILTPPERLRKAPQTEPAEQRVVRSPPRKTERKTPTEPPSPKQKKRAGKKKRVQRKLADF